TTANSYTISNPTTTTTYYVEGYNATTGCISASRTAVTLTVNPLPAAPTIPNVTTCAGTSATLTISSPVGGTTYNWYTVSTGGTSVNTGPTYTISNPATTTTYYVEAVSAGCISASRTAVTLTVNPLPAAPTIPNVTSCAGTSATLTVSSPVAGISYRWYTAASGGTALTTANSYTISNPTTTTTYYVEGYNATTGCISASRTAVTLTVNPLPAAPAIPNVTTCAGTSATLTISSPVGGTTYNWYTVSTGGTSVNTGPTYTISNPATTTTYYVEAVSAGCISASRTAVTLTVNPLPAAPTIPNVTTCAGTSATLTISSPVGGTTYNWYTVSTGGTSVNTGPTYTISNPTTTTTYYVEGYNATTGCISASRTAVTLTVNPLPAAPTIPNVTTCAGTSVTLTISSPVGGTTYNWYTVSTGGTSVNTGPTYTISNPATTTTYYVEAVSAGCISASRTAVTLTVNPLPAAPTVPGKATCIGTSTTLSVSSPVAGATYRWYTTSTGGTSFFTGTDYTITNPAVTVTYYVETSNAGCVSTSRTAVTLTVNPLPVAPTVPNTATCSGTSVLLSVSSPVAGIIYRWYTSAGGGTVLNTGTNYIISNPTVTTTYYVEAFNETTGCTSLTRTAVTLTINPLPSVTLSPSPRICEGDVNASLPFVVANGGNQYKITWDPGTPVSFQNVTNWTNLSGNSITVSVPGNASYGVYTGKVSIYNSVNGCEGSLQSFSINIYPAQGKTHLTIQNIIN
ncbi:immunoglobulin domain-containing protein, partial [Sphingobacterium spiritivorum]|uniref:immunoglobulin domain-containing protein n=1 Tax=Sphingobacterium spiritivorum TaxID=258 RepID=UPI003DA34621